MSSVGCDFEMKRPRGLGITMTLLQRKLLEARDASRIM